ncbi:HAMP domain-containing protein [Nanoarchaeota archaeon]
MLILTIVPLVTLGYIALANIEKMEATSLVNILEMKNTAINDNTHALNELGKTNIKEKAKSVAREVQTYLESNPEKTLADLQKDPSFQKIAIQPIGKTGYTLIGDFDTLIVLFHKYPDYVNYDIHDFQESNPGLWGIASKVKGGSISEGFHMFKEPDGTLKEKYSYMYPISLKTSDGKGLFVAATTYLEEFNQAAFDTQKKLDKQVQETISTIGAFRLEIHASTLIFVLVMLLCVSIASIAFARTISSPIRKLRDAAIDVGRGNMSTKITVRSNDEIADLAQSFDQMRLKLKHRESLAVKDRNELFNTILGALKGKVGSIAMILLRDKIKTLTEKNPRILKIIPKSLASSLNKEKKMKKHT